MAGITKETLYHIQNEVREYVTSIKGENITTEDLVFAENLMVFGYKLAKDELNIRNDESKITKENMAIINSQWT